MKKVLYVILIINIIFSVFFLISCDKKETEPEFSVNTDFNMPTNLNDGNGERVKVILLFGQSNATGVALNSYLETNVGQEKYSMYKNGFDNVLINFSVDNHTNTSNGEFIKTSVGLGHKEMYFGPELGIAEKLSQEYPQKNNYYFKIYILR